MYSRPTYLILAFHLGFTPKEIIAKGIPVSTVYRYSARHNKLRKEIDSFIKKETLSPEIVNQKIREYYEMKKKQSIATQKRRWK